MELDEQKWNEVWKESENLYPPSTLHISLPRSIFHHIIHYTSVLLNIRTSYSIRVSSHIYGSSLLVSVSVSVWMWMWIDISGVISLSSKDEEESSMVRIRGVVSVELRGSSPFSPFKIPQHSASIYGRNFLHFFSPEEFIIIIYIRTVMLPSLGGGEQEAGWLLHFSPALNMNGSRLWVSPLLSIYVTLYHLYHNLRCCSWALEPSFIDLLSSFSQASRTRGRILNWGKNSRS
jgi:hypothetical protein